MEQQPLKDRIIKFLTSIPNINTQPGRMSFIVRASLDEKLVNQIDFSGTTMEFVSLLVDQITRYGKLEDGRDALEAVLRVAKDNIGREGQDICDAHIREWRVYCREIGDQTTVEKEDDNQEYLDYKYDVFFSYRRGSILDEWVHNIFLHRFKGYLKEYLLRPVRIFEAGETSLSDYVPPYRKIALAHSLCLVAICSPAYFDSYVHRYELAVMLQRERRLGCRLVLPVNVFDGERFPHIVTKIDWWCNCNDLISLSIVFTAKGVELDRKIIQLAAEVEKAIRNAPSWHKGLFDDLSPDDSIINSLQMSPEFPLPRW